MYNFTDYDICKDIVIIRDAELLLLAENEEFISNTIINAKQ